MSEQIAKETVKQNKTDNWKEYRKQYYEDNKDKLKEYFKEWNINNREKIRQYNKTYRDANRERLAARTKHCDCCNHTYLLTNFSKHKQSKKHILNMKLAQNHLNN